MLKQQIIDNQSQNPTPASGREPHTVLIIDDELMARTLVRLTLVRDGYIVHEAENGQVGLEQFESMQPDVVVLDVMMPGIDGFEVCQRIREKSADVPIIILSAKADIESEADAKGVGANLFLGKPVSPKILRAHIHKILIQ